MAKTTEWKDTSSYSRDDKERKPFTWSLTLGDRLGIAVTCGHIHFPGSWVMHCHWLAMEKIEIGPVHTMTLEQAQAEAISRVRTQIETYHALMQVCPTT